MSESTAFDLSSPIGLIAGSGSFPIEFTQQASLRGIKVVAVAFKGETDPALEKLVSKCLWLKVGQLGKLLSFFKKEQVKQVAMAGGISRVRLFGGVKPDLKALALISRLGTVRDDVILRGIADEIEKLNIKVISASVLLEKSVPKAGLLSKRDFSEDELKDASFGWDVARQTGLLDIGQTVAVLDGLVVAVEAVEGTDATIKRAGELSALARNKKGIQKLLKGKNRGAVIVKLCKPQQDLRLDLPTIGVKTIKSMIEAGASALLIEAQKTIMLEPDEIVHLANKHDIAIKVVSTKSDIAPHLPCTTSLA